MSAKNRSRQEDSLIFFVGLGVVFVDQVTKNFASQKNFFLALNFGISFGLSVQGQALLLSGFTYILLTIIFFLLLRKNFSYCGRLALTLFLAGGLSNIVDRLRFSGAVIDWILFLGLFTFNLADVAISLGVILLLYDKLSHRLRGQ